MPTSSTTASGGSLPFGLATLTLVLALAAAGLSFADFPDIAVYVLTAGIVALTAAGVMMGFRSPSDAAVSGDADATYKRDLAVHASSLILLVVFLLLAMVEVLAIPAAFGALEAVTAFGVAFVRFYPVVVGAFLAMLAGVVMLAARGPVTRALTGGERFWGVMAAGVAGIMAIGTLLTAAGLVPAIKAERAVFVLAASLVFEFFFLKMWLRLPTYNEVSDWLERNQRVKESGVLRKVIYALTTLTAMGIVVGFLAAFDIVPAGVGLAVIGLSMLTLMAATFNVGVSHVVPRLEFGDGAEDERKKRRVILSAVSIGLSVLGLAIAILTIFAAMAQAGGIAIFQSLLEVFVSGYLAIFGVALVPLMVAILVRVRVKSEVHYTPQLRAIAVIGATLALVLAFFGVFIGSGLAAGTGVQIENAVLIMGFAMLALITFVKARTRLPSLLSIVREAITQTQDADADLTDTIKTRMIATYVAAMLFVLGFAGFAVATSLGVITPPASNLGTDLGFFVYLLGGIALLVIVAMRYFQSVNMDPRWNRPVETDTIGKKRLTASQVQKYIILGFSIGSAVILFLIGGLMLGGILTRFGPLEVDGKYGTDFFVAAIMLGLGPYGYYQAKEAKRIEAIDAKFPEFLRDLAEGQRSGMTLTEAVLTAAKGEYGMLTDEIRKMSVQIQWGVSFADALERFASRVDTPLINRTVSLVVQASNAGGNVVDVLTAASNDAREIQQIVKERKQSMQIYLMIIYIAFAVFVGVIAVLNAQFIPEVAKAVKGADGVSVGGLTFKAFDEQAFKTVFFHAAIIQGLGGGLVGGVMSGGRLVHGLRHSFILVFASWVLFRLLIG